MATSLTATRSRCTQLLSNIRSFTSVSLQSNKCNKVNPQSNPINQHYNDYDDSQHYDDYKPKEKNHLPPYQKTWIDCIKPIKIEKKIMPDDSKRTEPILRRPRKKFQSYKCIRKPAIDNRSMNACYKIKLPGCSSPSAQGTCPRVKNPCTFCKPKKSPLPSFSECIKPMPEKMPADECHCFRKIPPCHK